jgi:hypothetical protein
MGGVIMLTSDFKMPIPPVKLQQALSDIIESIAMEDTALSNLINSESGVVDKVNKLKCDMYEYIAINESVNNMMKCIARLQMLLQFELEDANELLQRVENLEDDNLSDDELDDMDELEE